METQKIQSISAPTHTDEELQQSIQRHLEIQSQDVIRLIQQFLKENKLLKTLQCLQDETRVCLNTVENVESFSQDILQGRWETVLKTTRTLELPQKKLMDLYEQVILELIEREDRPAARILLRQTDTMQALRDQFPERYLHLESLLTMAQFHSSVAYGKDSKESRRESLAKSITSEISVVPSSRLLTLLGQALRWQIEHEFLSPETGFDLFSGSVPELKDSEDAPVKHCYATIQFPNQQHAEVVVFSPNGQMLVTGSSDGFIEIWNPLTGKLRKDLSYQAEDKMMGMESGILSMSFSKDSSMLVTGSQGGKIKVWKVSTGQCLKRFSKAHDQGVLCVALNKDASQVYSGGFDGMIRIHGMKSGKLLKELRGHSSFVNSLVFSSDFSRLFSGSSDGSVRIWESKSGDLIKMVDPANHQSILSLHLVAAKGQVLVGTQSRQIVGIDTRGQVSWDHSVETSIEKDTVAVTPSSRGDYVYLLTEKGDLVATLVSTKKEFHLETTDRAIGACSHPHANVLAIWNEIGKVSLWKS